MDARGLWGQVGERAQALLPVSVEARALLGNNGVTDEAVWSRYRLGATGPALLEAFSAAERERLIAQGLHTIRGGSPLRNPGILVPTFDPRDGSVVGFVKLTPAQNKHGFLTEPVGLACTSDIVERDEIVIADAPLLLLRLAQAGVRGVVLAETPEVLPPLADWLRARRRIVLASYKKAGLAALSEALQALGVESTPACIGLELARTGKATLALLGIDRSAVAVPQAEPAPLTAKVLADLVSFAQGRIGTSEARELLETLHAEDTHLIEALGIGYLPADYHKALPKDLRHTLKSRLVAHSLVVPALDDAGAVVDLLLVRAPNAKHPQFNLKDPPEGLVGARVARIHDDVLVTDSFRVLARLWTAGRENVLLLRDARDARLNAQRLAGSGVVKATLCTRRYMDSDGIAEALKAEGLAVTNRPLPKTLDEITSALFDRPDEATKPRRKAKLVPLEIPAPEAPVPLLARPEAGRESCAPPALGSEAPAAADPVPPAATAASAAAPSGLVLVGHDAAAELATYRDGEALYKIETSADAGSRLELRLEHRGKFHLDRFDLAVERQRRCFAMSAALRTGMAFEAIQEHLLQLLDGVRRLRETSRGCARHDDDAQASMSDAERAEALALLRRPELLDLLAADLAALGWVGEERNKRLLFLITLSRKLSNPLYGALRAVLGSGKSYEMGLIARLTPPEDLIQVTRLSDAALYHADPGALKRRLLVLDEADALTPEVLNALRVLHTRGALSKQLTEYDALQQRHRTRTVEVEGPLAVLTSTTASLEEQFLSRCFELAVDDSPEQTRRILEAQRHRRAFAEGQDGEPGSRIVRRCRNLQRLLEPLAVTIPFADRIVFPDHSVRYRRAQERFLTLIEASALLHQHQRLRDGARIVATEADFAVAVVLAGDAVEHAADELSANAREVLALIDTETLRSFTVQRIQALRPGWTRHKLRSGLAELEQFEFVAGVGRTKPRQYRRIATAMLAASSAPALRATGAMGALAGIGETVSPMQNQA